MPVLIGHNADLRTFWGWNFRLINLDGRTVVQQITLKQGAQELPPGLYLLQVQSKPLRTVKKLKAGRR